MPSWILKTSEEGVLLKVYTVPSYLWGPFFLSSTVTLSSCNLWVLPLAALSSITTTRTNPALPSLPFLALSRSSYSSVSFHTACWRPWHCPASQHASCSRKESCGRDGTIPTGCCSPGMASLVWGAGEEQFCLICWMHSQWAQYTACLPPKLVCCWSTFSLAAAQPQHLSSSMLKPVGSQLALSQVQQGSALILTELGKAPLVPGSSFATAPWSLLGVSCYSS